MDMFSFLKNSRESTVIAVFDIGSASVGGALISFHAGEKPKIIWSARESMVFQNDLNFGRFLSSMLETLEKVLIKMQQSEMPHPRSFLFLLSVVRIANARDKNEARQRICGKQARGGRSCCT